jgi:hypothetical protein
MVSFGGSSAIPLSDVCRYTLCAMSITASAVYMCSLKIAHDVHYQYEWETVHVTGTQPLARYYHTMTALPQSQTCRAVMMAGQHHEVLVYKLGA